MLLQVLLHLVEEAQEEAAMARNKAVALMEPHLNFLAANRVRD